MTIGKEILSMTIEELDSFVRERRAVRLITPKRKPARKTIKGLAKAWNIPEGIVEAAVRETLTAGEIQPKGETLCTRPSKKPSRRKATQPKP